MTGKKATTPRWKSCVGSASGSFSAAVGKMYVLKHFKVSIEKYSYILSICIELNLKTQNLRVLIQIAPISILGRSKRIGA